MGGPIVVFGYVWWTIFVYHTYRQLRVVARIHREAQHLDLYDDVPPFAFSRLSAQTGLAYLAVAYFTLIIDSGTLAGDVVSLGTSAVCVVVGKACFVLPLVGIHRRLATEKARLMEAANRRLHATPRHADEPYRRIDSGELAGIGDASNAISGVTATRGQISRLPTWPWPPQVLRGFITALLLPVVIWVATHVLGQIVG